MADMSVPRSEFAVGVIGKFIYAVAGRTRDETFYSTERYDITNDKWEFVSEQSYKCPIQNLKVLDSWEDNIYMGNSKIPRDT